MPVSASVEFADLADYWAAKSDAADAQGDHAAALVSARRAVNAFGKFGKGKESDAVRRCRERVEAG